MMPSKHNVEVLGILSDDAETDFVAPGENLKIRLKGIEEEEILQDSYSVILLIFAILDAHLMFR